MNNIQRGGKNGFRMSPPVPRRINAMLAPYQGRLLKHRGKVGSIIRRKSTSREAFHWEARKGGKKE